MELSGERYDFIDPDASVLRDSLPGQCYEPGVRSVLQQGVSRPGAVFFDIGALYGLFSLWAARAGADVVAFEPNPRYAAILELNLRRNDCAQARIERLALSNGDGVEMMTRRVMGGNNQPAAVAHRGYVRAVANQLRYLAFRGGAPLVTEVTRPERALKPWIAAVIAERLGLFSHMEGDISTPVRSETVDQWCEAANVRPTTVKIDVHGAEKKVVCGMRVVLARDILDIVIEVHTADIMTDGTPQDIIEELEAANLDVYELRHFRRHSARLVRLVGRAKERFCDQRAWTAEELYFMKCIYARRPESR
jgi:FkbM family methyltransferase